MSFYEDISRTSWYFITFEAVRCKKSKFYNKLKKACVGLFGMMLKNIKIVSTSRKITCNELYEVFWASLVVHYSYRYLSCKTS